MRPLLEGRAGCTRGRILLAWCTVILLLAILAASCGPSSGASETSTPSPTTTTEGPVISESTTLSSGVPTTTTTTPTTTALPPTTTPSSTTTLRPATTLRPTSTLPPTTITSTAAFESSIKPIDKALEAQMVASGSWRPGVPVAVSDLRLLQVRHWGFDGDVREGRLVVHEDWAEKLVGVFRALYDAQFPFRSIELIDAFGADDEASMMADNTSAFNGRYVAGTRVWSMHAYGQAIDINPVENPWVSGGNVSPENGRRYVDRALRAPGMIHADDVVVQAFASIGWKWGGYWNGTKDYQHFSSTGE
jgi:hypothetical protein